MGREFVLERFITFDRLLGGGLIKAIYYVGLAVILFGSLFDIVLGLIRLDTNGAVIVFKALGFLIFGVLIWRFICELGLVIFRISDDLRAIRTKDNSMTLNITERD